MINAADYKNSEELLQAINNYRKDNYSQYNPNPSIRIKIFEQNDKEYYEGFLSYNPFEKHWIISVTFKGIDNQLKPYIHWFADPLVYKNIKFICNHIMTWHNVGPQRIYLTFKRKGKLHE